MILILNDVIVCFVFLDISAANEESIPPLKSTPTGTSDIICLDTESFKSSSIAFHVFEFDISGLKDFKDQYSFIFKLLFSKLKVCPGNNFFIFLNPVFGAV